MWHHKPNLKLIGYAVLKISHSQGVSIAYILKSSMAAILVFAHGPKSIASVFSVVWYHISNLKLNGEMVLKISRSQTRRTDGRTTGISMSYPNFVCGGQQADWCYIWIHTKINDWMEINRWRVHVHTLTNKLLFLFLESVMNQVTL